eukprot:7287467-Pyramimonas_sp.AAC.1
MLTEVNGCAASGRRASDRLSAWMQTPTRCTSTSRTAMQWTACWQVAQQCEARKQGCWTTRG